MVVVTLPEYNIDGLSKSGLIYYNRDHVVKWLYDCRDTARANNLNEAADYVDGIIRAISTISEIEIRGR